VPIFWSPSIHTRMGSPSYAKLRHPGMPAVPQRVGSAEGGGTKAHGRDADLIISEDGNDGGALDHVIANLQSVVSARRTPAPGVGARRAPRGPVAGARRA
jgi:hypothetical protein